MNYSAAEPANPYRESLFQWVWQNVEFDCRNLATTCGKPVRIIDTGTLNTGAGPDFCGAVLQIGGLRWAGSVEIHKTAEEWYRHGHHRDETFNSVVLHVICCRGSGPAAVTASGARPFTLFLDPFLNQRLSRLLRKRSRNTIPCGANIAFINQHALERQVQTAHTEYFEYKTEEFLQEYPAGKGIEEAWKRALIIQLYKTLGIPGNRRQMAVLAKRVLDNGPVSVSFRDYVEEVSRLAFGDAGADEPIRWKRGGMRPASRPATRVKQAAAFHARIVKLPLNVFLDSPSDSWHALTGQIGKDQLPGRPRTELLKYTVYLPGVYLLGELLHSVPLMRQAVGEWHSRSQDLPEEVVRPFVKAGFEITTPLKKLGLAHQYKRYCREQNCHRCRVFKNAIRS